HLSKGIEKLLGTENAERFFTHPLIRALSPDKWFGEGTRRPSYLPSRTFAMTVLNLIKKGDASAPRTIADVKTTFGTVPDPLKKSLEMLLEEANQDVAEFEAALESWINHEPERATDDVAASSRFERARKKRSGCCDRVRSASPCAERCRPVSVRQPRP